MDETRTTELTPRWVKVFGIIALVLVLLVVVMLVTGRGGNHGPGRHSPSGDAGAPPSNVPEDHMAAHWCPHIAIAMTPRLRKFALTAHVTSSVGWLGAIAVFLALAVAGLTVEDAQMVRAAYLAMELTVWSVLVPLALASLLTGLVQSLGTTWGLFRHYWVLAKLLLTIVATIVLLMYTQTISYIAGIAAESADLRELRNPSPVLHAGVALLVLLATTTLAVYKPRGMTRYGRRKQHELRTVSQP